MGLYLITVIAAGIILIYCLTRDTYDLDKCEPGCKDCDICPFPRCEKHKNSKGE